MVSKESGEAGTKARILEAARIEFAAHGLAGARVDRIAGKAGVNKAMIYYHFVSKVELHTAVIRSHLADMLDLVRMQMEKYTTLEDILAQILEGHAQLFSTMPEFVPIMMREMAERRPEFMDRIASMMKETGIPELLKTKFEEERLAGRLRDIDPRQMVASLISMSIGYFIMAPVLNRVLNVTDRDEFIKGRKQANLDLFMNGVRTR